jgi:hypothetical protein
LSGGIKEGISEEFLTVLDAVNSIEVVHLNLYEGGVVSEAMQLRKIIDEKKLNTYVSGECVSACTIAFIAGNERFLNHQGRLGFHTYSMPGVKDDDMDQTTNKSYLRKRGISDGFISKVFNTPRDEMWYPTADELVKANVVHRVVDGTQFAHIESFTAGDTASNLKTDNLSEADASLLVDEAQNALINMQLGKPMSSENFGKFPKRYRVFLELFKLKLDRLILATNDYQTNLQSEEFANLLTPKELSQAKGNSPIIDSLLANLINFRTAANDYYVGLPQEVAILEIDAEFKKNFVTSFRENANKTYSIVSKYIGNQEEILKVIESMYLFCAKNSPEYDSSADQLLFTDDKAVSTFNSMYEKLSKLAVEEAEYIAEISKTRSETITEFQKQKKESGL